MDFDNNKLLEQYLYKIMKLNDKKKQQIHHDDLKSIALEVGLTEREFELVEKEAENHWERGKSYEGIQRWDDAQSEFEKAYELSPLNTTYIFQLAHHHYLRWQEFGKDQNFRLTEKWAKRTLQLDPKHSQSLILLNKISKLSKKKKTKRKVLTFFLSILLVFGGGGLLFIMSEEGVFRTYNGWENKKYSLTDFRFVENKFSEGIKMELIDVQIKHGSYYNNNEFEYEIKHSFLSEKYEISAAKIKFSFYSEGDTLLGSEEEWLMYRNEFVIRPGDQFNGTFNEKWSGISFLTSQPRLVKKVTYEITQLDFHMPPPEYPKAKALNYSWYSIQPEYLSFEIGYRRFKQEVLHPSDSSSQLDMLLEIKNTGSNDCRTMELLFEYYNEQDQKFDETTVSILKLNDKSLSAGNTLIYHFNEHFYPSNGFDYPVPYKRFSVKIKSAD